MSAQAPYGVAVATSVWNATLAQYLTEQLGDQLGCTFVFTPLPGVDAAYTVVQNNETDFLLTSSGLMHCLQVSESVSYLLFVLLHTCQMKVLCFADRL